MSTAVQDRPRRLRLWMILAALAALGVVATHAVHLLLATHISARALAGDHEALGRSVARVVAQQATDAVLLNDLVGLQETATAAAMSREVAYCFIVRDGKVVASHDSKPILPALTGLPRNDISEAVVVNMGGRRFLDIAQPILEGGAGTVRVGLDMASLEATEHELSTLLRFVAALVILLGLATAAWVARWVVRPLKSLVDAADHFDPRNESHHIHPQGSVEVAELTERFNEMMLRLKSAHDEQERTRQKNIETHRLAALGALVAGVAHEINNPLAGLKNCHRRLERDDLPALKRTEYFELMRDALDRLEHVVQGLLDFGRPRPLHLETVPLRDIVHDACSLVAPVLSKRGISIAEQFSDDEARLLALADRRQIGQALLNLLLNAAYVTKGGGTVAVQLRLERGMAGISVRDDGPGIPASIRERVFDPFFTTKPEGEGTGLGLSVSRSIVAVHGGELSFEFPRSGGTVASIWLRLAPGDAH